MPGKQRRKWLFYFDNLSEKILWKSIKWLEMAILTVAILNCHEDIYEEVATAWEFMIYRNLDQLQTGTEVWKGCLTYSTVSVLTRLNYNATHCTTDLSCQRKALHNNSNLNPSQRLLDENKKRDPPPASFHSPISGKYSKPSGLQELSVNGNWGGVRAVTRAWHRGVAVCS